MSIDNFGVMLVDYDSGTPLPDESHILQAPDATKWTVLANGGTGIVTVTDGATGVAEAWALTSPNGIEWLVSVDNNGVLMLTSFEGAIIFAPIVNNQMKVDGVPAEGYRLFAFQAGSVPPVTVPVYKNSTFIEEQLIPIVLDAYGFPTDAVFIKVGEQYKFELYTPTGSEPIKTWDYVSAGLPSTISTPAEWINPPVTASFSASPDSFVVPGDQRSIFRPGRRVKCIGASVLYGTIFIATYGGINTTVTIFADSGTLDTTFTHVTFALLSPYTNAVPSRRYAGLKTVLQGPMTIPTKDGLNVLPVGTVALEKGPATAGWLACNGAIISRTTYAALFAAIGTTFGAGDGSTTFAIPNITPSPPISGGGIYVIYAKV